jgi:hypothetical protein
MNTIDSILGFLALSSALVFAALVIFNNDYNRWTSSRVVISGLVAMVLVLANIVFSSHTEWRLKSKEVARVYMNQTQGFQFKYVSLQGKQIPLLNGEYEPYKKLLNKWSVDFKPGVFERQPTDTVYCYYLEQYKMGVATGDVKLLVDTAPMPDYEFTLFYEQSTAGTQILPDSLVQ